MGAPLYMTPPCGSDRIVAAMHAGELGMITTPKQGNKMVPGVSWCADNGVFGGAYPGHAAFLAWLAKLTPYAADCRFVVAPDVVGNHWATKEAGTAPFSLPGEDPEDARGMLARIRELGFPVAFVAQPGLEYDSWDLWEEIDALFIGGGDDWKESAAVAELIAVANSLGVWTHVGRVNTWERYQIAAAMGADSVDGTMLTRGPDINLARVQRWLDRVLGEADAMFGVEQEFAEVNGWNPDRPRQRGKFTAAPPPTADDQRALFAA